MCGACETVRKEWKLQYVLGEWDLWCMFNVAEKVIIGFMGMEFFGACETVWRK
jgi:hypothetical protein